MPRFLEKQLEKEYGKGDPKVYQVMNKMGFMRGNKETEKGKKAAKTHESKEPKDKGIAHEGRLDDKTKGQMIQKLSKKGK